MEAGANGARRIGDEAVFRVDVFLKVGERLARGVF